MKINDKLSQSMFESRENQESHLAYDREMKFFQAIKDGDAEEAKRLFKPLSGEGFGKLSRDPLTNHKYHLIITVAFITRYVIEGGMDMETAYSISDIYINRIDRCSSIEEVNNIHRNLIEDYIERMRIISKKGMNSKPITLCLDHITKHLHSRITLEELAQVCGLSAPYLSKLFHSEIGDYIPVHRAKADRGCGKSAEIFRIYQYRDIKLPRIQLGKSFHTDL